jgi:hypothetical protein
MCRLKGGVAVVCSDAGSCEHQIICRGTSLIRKRTPLGLKRVPVRSATAARSNESPITLLLRSACLSLSLSLFLPSSFSFSLSLSFSLSRYFVFSLSLSSYLLRECASECWSMFQVEMEDLVKAVAAERAKLSGWS